MNKHFVKTILSLVVISFLSTSAMAGEIRFFNVDDIDRSNEIGPDSSKYDWANYISVYQSVGTNKVSLLSCNVLYSELYVAPDGRFPTATCVRLFKDVGPIDADKFIQFINTYTETNIPRNVDAGLASGLKGVGYGALSGFLGFVGYITMVGAEFLPIIYWPAYTGAVASAVAAGYHFDKSHDSLSNARFDGSDASIITKTLDAYAVVPVLLDASAKRKMVNVLERALIAKPGKALIAP